MSRQNNKKETEIAQGERENFPERLKSGNLMRVNTVVLCDTK